MKQSIGYFSLSILFCSNLTAQVSQPNIIVIMTDDQGWGDLSFNGNLSVSTPNIDRIAKEGVSFSNFYVCPVSSPTRAEFLTGRYATRVGVRDVSGGGERLNLDETTIADYFKAAGYITAAFGKWHNGTQYPYHPNARGFDEFYGFCSGHWGNYWNPMLEHNGEIVYGEGFIIDDLTEKAIGYIQENRENPFFLYLPYNTPHSPMQVPDKWWNKVKDREIQQKTTTMEQEDIIFTRAALAFAENIDWNVGRVMQAVNSAGLDNNTIIVYLSDNGPNSNRWNGGMKGRKGSTDEGGVRSPLFIRWPGHIPVNQNVDQLTGVIDLMPTLIGLSGISCSYKNKLDGINLKDVLFMPTLSIDRTLFSFWNKKESVREGNYLLDSEGCLYNVRTDRPQKHNIALNNKEVVDRMKQALDDYGEEVLRHFSSKDSRPFGIAHPKEKYSKLPARDGNASGIIERSNRYPNSSYFMNWKETNDSIYWNVSVESSGIFEVFVYYTCSKEDVGSVVQLTVGGNRLTSRLEIPNDIPMIGAELDRVPRAESYSKGFAPYSLGTIYLEEGEKAVSLKALSIPGDEVMNFQMLVFRRINGITPYSCGEIFKLIKSYMIDI